eukprot:TRINITY_DN4718_c0_g1_i1.p1 TRINITY_DN4718_c0_g1~~TRINITY_DN4718_c0_g1_i1.p1  ORF type:complete len:725 (+),score=184.72 TRINITY_DN4718_c0_g1_i1:48-2222(+)
MESTLLTEEQRKLLRSASQGRDGAGVVGSPKNSESGLKLLNNAIKTNAGATKVSDRKSHSGRNGRPKKGGGGGKGTWGTLLEGDDALLLDRKDPNYDSEEEPYKLVGAPIAQSLEEYKEKVVTIVEEHFVTADVAEAAASLRDLGSPDYHHHFVKKLISMALDRHDREKEMASVLLSALYADVIHPDQLAKGFLRLLESVDDLSLDIPDASDVLALFLARAVVDDILPPAFLSKAQKALPEDSQGVAVILKAEKSYLLAPHHAEVVERRWGGTTHVTVEEVKKRIGHLLSEYVESGDKAEACRSIRELNVPFFHHEVVKNALTLAMEKRRAESLISSLLQEAAEEALITSSQMSKGFTRLLDALEDLELDVPHAIEMAQSLVAKAIEGGWLSSSFAKTVVSGKVGHSVEHDEARTFKQSATTIIQEYFLSGDISEVVTSLEDLAAPEYHGIFIKKLLTLAMEKKNHEKEMASALLSALYAEVIPIAQIEKGFILLLESAEDTALDIPDAANQLALFLARAVVDDVLAPLYLEEIDEELKEGSLGREIVHSARAVLAARHAGERILRCWGGGTGRAVEDAKDKINKLLEEFEAGGELLEACECIRELDMSFFHHEVVKKALLMAMEKQNDRLLSLLQECSSEGLITTSQMLKGFGRVADTLEDFALDFPAAKGKFVSIVQKAKEGKWLSSSFTFEVKPGAVTGLDNGDVIHHANGDGQATEKASR